jgi:PAS domain S-box-containing protein
MLAVMLVFEVIKQFLAPDITIWESHVVTVIFTGIVAGIVCYFPLRNAYREQERALTAEAALRGSEEMFRGVAERSSDLIMLTDEKGVVTYIAPSVKRVLGFDPDDVMGRGPEDFLHPEDLEIVYEAIRDAHEGKTFEPVFGVRIRNKDGGYAILELSGTPVLKDGVFSGMQIIGRDITTRTLAEEALRESEEKFRMIFENSNDPILLVEVVKDGATGTFIDANEKAFTTLGYKKEELLGRDITQINSPEMNLKLPELLSELFAKGHVTIEGEVVRKDGSFVPAEISAGLVKFRDKSFIITIARDITERKKGEAALRESREMYRELVENINDVIFTLDLSGNFTYISPVIERIYGYTPEVVIGKHFSEYIHPDDHPRCIEAFRKRLKGEYGLNEFRVMSKDGRVQNVMVSQRPILNGEGEVAGFNYIMTNITGRKKAEEALTASEERYRALAEAALDPIYLIGRDDTVLYINNRGAQLLKRTPEEIIGRPRGEFFPADTVEKQARSLLQVFDTGKPLRNEWPVRYGNQTHWQIHSLAPVKDADGAVTAVLGIAYDITERKQAEERLNQQFRFLQQLIDSIPNPIFYKDAEAVYTGCNRAFEEYIGLSKEQIIGKSVYQISPKELADKYYEMDRKLLDHPGSQVYDARVRYADGKVHDVVFSKATFSDVQGKVQGLVGVILDITDRKEMEEALRKSEQRSATLLKAIPDMMFVLSRDGIYRDFSAGDASGLAIPPDTLIGSNLRDAGFGEEAVDAILFYIQQALATRTLQQFEYELIVPHGLRQYEARLVALSDEEVLGIVRDITEEKEAENALKMSETRYRVLFDESPIPLWEEDLSALKECLDAKEKEGVGDIPAYFRAHPEEVALCARGARIVDLNHAAMALFGAASFEQFQEGLSAIFPLESQDTFVMEITELDGGKREFENEVPLRTLRGEDLKVIMKVTVVPGHEESMSRVLVSVIDITRRTQIEEALHQANKKLNILSSITRHDILNLIMAVRGYLELSEELVKEPELQGYIVKEIEAVDAIQRQIEFTRYYQDIGVEEPKWQEAGELVRKVAQQLDMRGITVENDLQGVEFFADPLIEKVFYNLFENSLRHGEHVTAIGLSYSETGNRLLISYRDNGTGISAEDKKHLFQRGFGKHTGLGLFLSREILSITGITISENGEPENGVNFEILVPKGSYRISGG